jgi:galactose mutarotase-like enzyme
MGPVEDFAPIGYEEAKPGDPFLKIGIGMVKKLDDKPYTIVPYFTPLNTGVWKIKKKSDQVSFTHELNDREYSYRYEKTVQLLKGKAEMVLSHTLKNTGKKAIETNVYDHNFFVLDQQQTGKDFTITFPFNLTGEAEQGDGVAGKIENNKIVFLKEFARNEHLYYHTLKGYGTSAKDYDIRIENHKTGAAVRITSDQPLSKLVFWSAAKTVCPEPYIKIKVNPGEKFSWKISYQFYICDIINQ